MDRSLERHVRIETERLWMRPLEDVDAEALLGVWGDPEVMRYCGGAGDEERLRRAVRSCKACQAERGYSPFAVLDKPSGQLIGVCGFKSTEDPEGAELIYHFTPAVWGRGYATEAARAALDWLRKTLPLRYVEASIDPMNGASRKVLAKAGFVFVEDRWFDDVQLTEPVFRLELSCEEKGA